MSLVLLLALVLKTASDRRKIPAALLLTAWNLGALLLAWLDFLQHGRRF